MTGFELKAIRQNAGLSIGQMCALVRMNSASTYREIESGKRPMTGPLSLLAELLRDGRLEDLREAAANG